MRNSKSFLFGATILGIIILGALFGPLLYSQSPVGLHLEQALCTPNAQHLLGCDANGTDILAILLSGARVSLTVGVVATLLSVMIGLIVGSLSGFYGGLLDTLCMRLLEIIFAFPGIILAIALASLLRPSYINLVFCLSITSWAAYARLVRGEVRLLLTKEYIESARALGMNSRRIITHHLWPNLFSTLLVAATFGFSGMILAEASLSFLGIGVPAGTPSWGALLSFGKDVLAEAPHVASFPGIALMLTVLGFNLLGEGLRKLFVQSE